MKTEWPKRVPNKKKGICVACRKDVDVGRGIWMRHEHWKEASLYHADEIDCNQGWIYILPECGPNRDLVKIGQATMLKSRVNVLWGTIWKLRGSHVRTFWAAEVCRVSLSEKAALDAMAHYRAYLIDPAHPSYKEWTEANPMPLGAASTRDRLAWVYEKKAEILRVQRSCKINRCTPGWTELFQCDPQVAIDVVGKAINRSIHSFSFDHLSTDKLVERCD